MHMKNDTTVYLNIYTNNKILNMEDKNFVDFQFFELKQIKVSF